MRQRILVGIAIPIALWVSVLDVPEADARAALLLFAALNLLIGGPATTALRWINAGVGLVGVVAPEPIGVALLLCVLWPFTFLIHWLHSVDKAWDDPSPPTRPLTSQKLALAGLIVSVGVAVVVYQWLVAHRLGQSAALFVGIPTVIAVVVTLFTSPTTANGVIAKAITIALLVSGIFLWEGVVCIVMAAPIFYAAGAVVGTSIDQARRARRGTAACLVLLALGPLSLEDAVPGLEVGHREVVSETRVVQASAADVENAIFSPPRIDRRLPAYLRAGFPRPIATSIADGPGGVLRWTIQMRGGEMRFNGMEPRTGDLVLDVTERGPHHVRWRAVSDDSHMTHFLFWREAAVTWEPIGDHATRVTWTLVYDRGLAPSWYFGPWERYASRLAAGYLIDAVATP